MAAGAGLGLLRAAGAALRGPGGLRGARDLPRLCSTHPAPKGPPRPPPSPFQERPWEYLESEEYQQTYGEHPVWRGYRRNHKGGVPPQRTRKACLRRGKAVGNPCPICRDPHLLVDFRNVKLLDQFICPHSGGILHPTHTGVCMKQHKLLTKAIAQAQDHGLLWLRVPYVPVPLQDFSNQHPAVSKTPPAPLGPGGFWYPWYQRQSPPPDAIARVRRLYRGYLKEEAEEAAAPQAPELPPDTPPAPSAEPRP